MSETTNLKLFKQDNPTTNTNNFDIEKTLNANWDKLDENAGTTNKKLESLEKVDSTTNETITAIQEEQTTQNENIEKNAEGIAQNKKDVDEELTKIKKENSLLKSQIPTGTASGNNIHLGDSSNMDFEWKLRGGSKQAIRSGKNVINVRTTVLSTYSSIGDDDWVTIEYTNTAETGDAFCNFFSELTKELKADTYYSIICEIKSVTTTASGYLSITNNHTSFAFPTTIPNKRLVELKAGDIIINKLKTRSDLSGVTGLLRTFVAVNPKSSVKIVFRLSVIEGDVTADSFEYESYGVSPSVEFLSGIKNVGDNINLYNKNDTTLILDAPISNNAVGTRASGTYKTVYIPCEPNTSYVVTKKYDETKNRLIVACSTEIPNYSQSVEVLGKDENATELTVLTSNTAKYLLAYVWIIGGSTTIQEMLDSIKIEKGEATSYSNYNCGSFGVTISNRNLFNPEWLVIGNLSADGQEFIQNNYARTKHISVEPNENLSITMFDTTNFRASALYFYDKDKNLIKRTVAPSNVGWDNFSTMGNCKYIRFTIAVVGSKYSTFTEEALQEASNNLQLERGVSTSYIPHKEQEIVFPLTEGQKLYEGSYLAEDGIHNKRKQIVLTGNENIFESQLGTYQTFGIVISGIKQGTKLMSNYFTSYPIITDIKYKVGMTNNNAADRLYISNGESSKTEEFKAWLSQRLDEGIPVIIEYELATEEIIPYTQEQQAVIDKILYTYKNVTNISVDDELATLDITYKKDIETMFNNQAKEYNERLSNIENLLNTTETSALLLDNLENDLEKEV